MLDEFAYYKAHQDEIVQGHVGEIAVITRRLTVYKNNGSRQERTGMGVVYPDKFTEGNNLTGLPVLPDKTTKTPDKTK
jgi:hypothetical protein